MKLRMTPPTEGLVAVVHHRLVRLLSFDRVKADHVPFGVDN